MSQMISRNVVILGKVRSGKRTLGNRIVGGDIFKPLDTGNVGVYYGEGRSLGETYRILTIDTENHQTDYNDPVPYIKKAFQEIHLIIFTIPHGLYTNESHGSLMRAVGSFQQQAKSVSALVITHCDGLSDAQREPIIAVRSKEVVDFMQRGTYAVGYPSVTSIPQDETCRDEEVIRQLVKQCEVAVSTKSLDIQQPKQQRSGTEPDHERPLIDLEWEPTVKTAVNAGLGVPQTRKPMHEAKSASQPKIPGQGIPLRPRTPEKPPGYSYRPRPRPSDTTVTALQRQPLADVGPTFPAPKTPVNVGLGASQPKKLAALQRQPLVDSVNVGLGVPQPAHKGLTGANSHSKTPGQGIPRPNTPERQLENQSRPSRNVVILGKAGSGKRTLGNHIVGKNIFQRDSALGTRNVGVHYREVTIGNTIYRILTVDTESLQTSYNNPIPDIQQKFQEIHSIIFAIPHGRYTDESHWSLMHAVENLHHQAKSVSALVITHCEGMTDEQREAIIAEFREDTRSLQVVAFMKHGTIAVGFPDISTLPPEVKPILQNAIDRDEKAIRKLVERCELPLSTKSLSGFNLGFQQPFRRPSPTECLEKQARESVGDGFGLRQFVTNNCNIL